MCTADIGRISGTLGGTQTGSASCTWTGSAGNTLPGQSYTVYAVLGGNYGGASDDDSINVHYPATSNTMTGGGYIVATAEAGAYAGKAGSKTNFGVNVKYNKSGANLQGNVNIIVRNGTTMYQFKSNSLTQLSVTLDTNANPLSGTCAATLPYSCATFISKGSGQMWQTTNPSAVASLGGNWTIQVQMHDVADPGTGKDSIGITVWDNSGAIVFSSNWSNGTTGEQTIGGGNLQVH